MKDKLISQQISEIAIEKGFKGGIYYTPQKSNNKESVKKAEELEYYLFLCEIKRWLRKEHDIHISINALRGEKNFDCDCYYIKSGNSFYFNIGFNTYESALEEGLKEALLIIKL